MKSFFCLCDKSFQEDCKKWPLDFTFPSACHLEACAPMLHRGGNVTAFLFESPVPYSMQIDMANHVDYYIAILTLSCGPLPTLVR